MKNIFKILVLSFLLLISNVSSACHGMALVNYNWSISGNNLVINANSDSPTCGCGPYYLEVNLSCTPNFTSPILPCNLLPSNVYPWYHTLLNVPNYTAGNGWPDQCIIEPYNTLTIPLGTLCPGQTYWFRARERVCGSNSNGPWTATNSFVVPGNMSPITSTVIANPSTICAPNCTQISATNTSGGCLGPGGNYSYLWQPGNFTTTSINVCPTVNTTYTLTISTPCGQSANYTVPIVVTTPPISGVASVNPTNICNSGNITLTLTGYVGTIQWQSGPTSSGPWTNIVGGTTSPFIINNLTSNTCFQAIVTGCNSVISNIVCVTVNPNPNAIITSFTNVTCFGLNNGNATINSFSSYSWNTNPSQSGQTATGLGSGTYVVTVTDINGCTDTASITITEPPQLNINITNIDSTLCWYSCDGLASINVSGGTPNYLYSWNTNPSQTTNTANNLCPGNYNIVVTDINGCTSISSVLIEAPQQQSSLISATPILCYGDCNATATINPSGGTPGYTFLWGNGQTTQIATGLCAGNYNVTIYDTNGCTNTNWIVINQPSQLFVGISASQLILCNGQFTNINANPVGGIPGYSYSWSPGGQTSSSITVSPTSTTNYVVFVTDVNGCTITANINIIVNPLPIINFIGTPLSGCAPLCVDFTNLTPNTLNCSWSFGDNTSGIGFNNINHCYNNPGSYNISLTVTDVNGCTNSQTILNMVNVFPSPSAQFSFNPLTTTITNPQICFTDLSIGNSNWSWDFGDGNFDTIQNPCHNYLDTGNYCVKLTISNNNGCYDSIIYCLIIGPDFTFFVPNAFSPNEDNKNEVFLPKGYGLKEDKFKFWVFDRWGNEIFYTENWNKGWDGRANGGEDIAQIDVYVWVVEIYDYFDKKHNYVGHVSLIK